MPPILVFPSALYVALAASVPCGLPETPPSETDSPANASPWAPSDWTERAVGLIRLSEYEFAPREAELSTAPNRANGFLSSVTPDGLSLSSLKPSDPPIHLSLRLVGVGRGAVDDRSVERGRLEIRENRAVILRDGLVEWYQNDERGIEQGFEIAEPGAKGGDRPLVLRLGIGGSLAPALLADDGGGGGGSVIFSAADGSARLRYDRLAVFDADGRSVPASLSLSDGGLSIRIRDAGFRYPILVDPIISAPNWSVVGANAEDELGYSLGAAGDVNGDGLADIVIGVDNFYNTAPGQGRVNVYHGRQGSTPASTPDWTAANYSVNQALAFFGFATGSAGDVDFDGYGDLFVSAVHYHLNPQNPTPDGAVLIYRGSANGLLPVTGGTMTNAHWTARSDVTGAKFGYSVTSGNFNADLYSDVVIGAPIYNVGGAAFAFYGPLPATGSNPATPPGDWRAISGQAVNTNFGFSVANAGDLNNDTTDDLIVGSPTYPNASGQYVGRAFVWLGGAVEGGTYRIGNPCNFAMPDSPSTACWYGEGSMSTTGIPSYFGFSVSSTGDINNDGFDDIIVGAPQYSFGQNYEGRIYVWYGRPIDLTLCWSSPLGPPGYPADWGWEPNQAGAFLGFSVSKGGRIDSNDVIEDVIAAAHKYDATIGTQFLTDVGCVFFFKGREGQNPLPPFTTACGTQAGEEFGYALAGVGDVNGDGLADVLVGSPEFDLVTPGQPTVEGVGKASLFLGR